MSRYQMGPQHERRETVIKACKETLEVAAVEWAESDLLLREDRVERMQEMRTAAHRLARAVRPAKRETGT